MAASKINGQSRLRIRVQVSRPTSYVLADGEDSSISGLVVEYIVAIDVTRVRFPADAPFCYNSPAPLKRRSTILQTSFLIRRDFAGRRAGMQTKTTARGFEPLRAEPNGFRVHVLSRSDTVSCDGSLSNWPHEAILEMLRFAGERELQTTRSTFPELCSLLGLANLQEGCNVQEKCGE